MVRRIAEAVFSASLPWSMAAEWLLASPSPSPSQSRPSHRSSVAELAAEVRDCMKGVRKAMCRLYFQQRWVPPDANRLSSDRLSLMKPSLRLFHFLRQSSSM
ncbi:hypothetical protein JZ751_003656 [Albula glossodonta]|uniref:Uncharacterized protein n=1 Tax=Albula glossodonta TaxID=121402 RepID=A0A8T2N767_9TELE|nr:hypothetical protein JZ751_003656 [Albula glossodonta]